MQQILRTTLLQDEVQAADGVPTYDLPVNPLSIILVTVKALNETAVITNYRAITHLLAAISDLRIMYRGANIIQGSLTDLAILMAKRSNWAPHQLNQVELDNDIRSITVPILFGRRPYDPLQCFPATRRGDLVLQLTTDVANTGYDNLVLQIETVELLEAQPTSFTKITTSSKIHNAVSDVDVDLPIGNDILGIMLASAVPPLAAVYDAQFGKVALQVDNVETLYSVTNWESLHGELLRQAPALAHMQPHIHSVNAAGAGRENTLEQQEANAGSLLLDQYGYLDLDPLEDGSYALKTPGASRVNLRITCEVASATAFRVLPVELVKLSGDGASPA